MRVVPTAYTGDMNIRVLILPGWQNSGPGHWQSRWVCEHGFERVEQHDWQRPLRGDWITRLETEMLLNSEHSAYITSGLDAKNGDELLPDTVLVAHSLGCHLVAAWAAVSRSTGRIRGALLVAPPDCEQVDFPVELHSWRRPVWQRLPFPSLCVSSSNDPFDPHRRAPMMAAYWGSEHISLGHYGHINAQAGLGDWPAGLAMLRQWLPSPA